MIYWAKLITLFYTILGCYLVGYSPRMTNRSSVCKSKTAVVLIFQGYGWRDKFLGYCLIFEICSTSEGSMLVTRRYVLGGTAWGRFLLPKLEKNDRCLLLIRLNGNGIGMKFSSGTTVNYIIYGVPLTTRVRFWKSLFPSDATARQQWFS